jgi:hypothetical protein
MFNINCGVGRPIKEHRCACEDMKCIEVMPDWLDKNKLVSFLMNWSVGLRSDSVVV